MTSSKILLINAFWTNMRRFIYAMQVTLRTGAGVVKSVPELKMNCATNPRRKTAMGCAGKISTVFQGKRTAE